MQSNLLCGIDGGRKKINKALISRLNQSSYSNAQPRWLIRVIDCFSRLLYDRWRLDLNSASGHNGRDLQPGSWALEGATHPDDEGRPQPPRSIQLVSLFPFAQTETQQGYCSISMGRNNTFGYNYRIRSVASNIGLIVRQLSLHGWLQHRIWSDMPVGSLCRLRGAIIILNVKLWAFTYGSLNEEICPLFCMILEAGPKALAPVWFITEGRRWKMHHFLILVSWNES